MRFDYIRSILLAAILASAASVLHGQSATASPSADETATSPRYRLAAGDEIEVRLTYNPTFNERVQIRPDGYISLALVGEVSMAGETIEALTHRLEQAYAEVLTQPQLTIQVRSYANRKIFVGGEVGRPGIVPLVSGKTVLEAIVESGGMRPSARRGVVTVIRRDQAGNPMQIPVAYGDKDPKTLPMASSFQLEPLDVVIVAESGISKVNRGVDQYVRQMIPILVTGGFTYLFGPSTTYVGQ